MRPRLLTIPLSHYCERARWALDLAYVDYDEVHTLQFYVRAAVAAAGGAGTVPVLQTDDGVLADSADIVQWADARSQVGLYPDDPIKREAIETYERDIADGFGDAIRRVTYVWFFRSWSSVLAYNDGAAPPWQKLAIRVAGRPMLPFVKRYLDLSPAKVAESHDIVAKAVDDAAKRLSDGRPYLFGDTFSAADLTFASLFAIAILPEEYGMRLPPLHEVQCPEGRAFVERSRAHPAGQYVTRMYEMRPPPRYRLAREPTVSRSARRPI